MSIRETTIVVFEGVLIGGVSVWSQSWKRLRLSTIVSHRERDVHGWLKTLVFVNKMHYAKS